MQMLIILSVALLLVLTVIKFRLLRRTRRRLDSMVPPLQEMLPDGVVARPRMLLYFYSEHCVPCRTMTPLIEELHRRGEEVVKVDVRRHLMTACRFGIRSTPALVLVDNGQVACVHVGSINNAGLHEFFMECPSK